MSIHPITSLSRLRRLGLAIGLLVVAGWLVGREAVPAVVASQLHRRLAALGFPHARFEVASVGLHHLRLTGVELADGLDLGDVELDGGISLLWQDHGRHLTIRGARVSSAALARLGGGIRRDISLPFDQVRLEDDVVALSGGDAEVAGTIDFARGVDLHARLARVAVGTYVLRAVEVSVHDVDGELELRGHVHDAGIDAEASSRVPRSLSALVQLRELTATWSAIGASWTAHGATTIGWRDGPVTLGGHLDASVTSPAIRITAQISGPVTALQVRGEARATDAALGALLLHDAALPFSLVVGPRDVTAETALVVSAERATVDLAGTAATIGRPAITMYDAGPVALAWPARWRWRARVARIDDVELRGPSGTIDLAPHGVQTIAWTALTGAWSLRGGAGELEIRSIAGGREVTGHVHAGGGELTLAPAIARADRPFEATVRARGVELARVLEAAGARVRGTGQLDGDLTMAVGGGGWSVVAGTLHARAPGELRVADPTWLARAAAPISGLALQQRLVGALTDFGYTDLAIAINPRGHSPELRLTTRGRGKLTPQDLDVTINMNGVRDALARHDRRPH